MGTKTENVCNLMYFFCLLSWVLDLTQKHIFVCLDPRSNNFESGSATLVLSRNGLFTIFWLNLCDDIVWTLKMYEYHAGFKKQEYVLLDIDIINIEGRYDTVQKRNFLYIDWSFTVKTCFAISISLALGENDSPFPCSLLREAAKKFFFQWSKH